MTIPMPTVFDVNVQPEEFEDDFYGICPDCGEPIDYCLGGHELGECMDCGVVIPADSLSGLCGDCDTTRFLEEEKQFEYGFNVLYYHEFE